MATYYAAASIADGTVNAGTSEETATSLRDAVESKATVAGDIVYVKADATGALDPSVNTPVTFASSGTAGVPIIIEGYTTTVGDGGQVEFAADARDTNPVEITGQYLVFKGLKLSNVRVGWNLTGTNQEGVVFYDCEVNGCDFDGFTASSPSLGDPGVRLIRCLAVDCGADGFLMQGRGVSMARCVAIACASEGFRVGNAYAGAIIDCLAHACGTGFRVQNSITLYHCNANDCTGDGIYLEGSSDQSTVLVNCAATNNGGYGLAGVASQYASLFNFGTFGNVSGRINSANVTAIYDIGGVTTDPLFAAPNPATESNVDLRLGEGSPYLEAGIKWPTGFTSMG